MDPVLVTDCPCNKGIALELLHDKFGHLGIDRTTGLSCERFFWPRMAEEIRQYIQNCE